MHFENCTISEEDQLQAPPAVMAFDIDRVPTSSLQDIVLIKSDE
jgi:hypothetical protein